MSFYQFFIAPFTEYDFLLRALLACIAISLGSTPIGTLLLLRRMSLMGDALSHAVLPGAAIGYLIAGLSLMAMTVGGLIAGLLIALLAGYTSRKTILQEDATLAGFFILSLALGGLIVTASGSTVDLMHFLFGNILAVDQSALILISGATTLTLVTLSLIYRPIIIECFDRSFFHTISGYGQLYHFLFLGLVVVNLVAAFQTLGTLLAFGLMMLPAIVARLWSRNIASLFFIAAGVAIVGSYIGLLCSFHLNWPSGPSIIVIVGILFILSLIAHGTKRQQTK